MICKACACDADEQVTGIKIPGCEEDHGHGNCKGCDCQHKPVKEGQIKGE